MEFYITWIALFMCAGTHIHSHAVRERKIIVHLKLLATQLKCAWKRRIVCSKGLMIFWNFQYGLSLLLLFFFSFQFLSFPCVELCDDSVLKLFVSFTNVHRFNEFGLSLKLSLSLKLHVTCIPMQVHGQNHFRQPWCESALKKDERHMKYELNSSILIYGFLLKKKEFTWNLALDGRRRTTAKITTKCSIRLHTHSKWQKVAFFRMPIELQVKCKYGLCLGSIEWTQDSWT